MSYLVDGYHGDTVATAPVNERVAFIRRTYAHLAGAVFAFVALSAGLIATGVAQDLILNVFVQKGAWIGLMVVFIGGSYAAQYMAQGHKSVEVKYAGLALYVLLYTILFVPILSISTKFGADPKLPLQAGIVTLAVFAGLTAAVFVSGKDFSFLGPILWICSFLALGVIIASWIAGFSLGLIFISLMVAMFSAWIIYDTSNIIHRYQTNEHVAASMALFGSVAMLFYYILMLFMSREE